MTILDHFGPFLTILTILTDFDHLTILRFLFCFFSLISLFRTFFFGRFDTSGSMIPRLVPEILPLDAFCDVVVVAGIGDSRSWIVHCSLFFVLLFDCLFIDQENPIIEKREGLRKKKDKEKTRRMLARLRKPVMTLMMKTMMVTLMVMTMTNVMVMTAMLLMTVQHKCSFKKSPTY